MEAQFDLFGQKINIDVIKIGNYIEGLVVKYGRSANRREAFVKDLLEHLRFSLTQENVNLNILIFNMQQSSDLQIQEVYKYWSVPFDGTTYGVWLFKSGTIENCGEGTYANWGMCGRFKRSGPKVKGGKMGRFVDFNQSS